MPQTATLTPAKVRAAVGMAETMLRDFHARREGQNIASMMHYNKLIPSDMQNEFASFYVNYKASHPDVRIDLRDFGDKTQLTEAQRNLNDFEKNNALKQADKERLTPLADMLMTFFEENNRLASLEVTRFLPEECGFDNEKANAVTDLFVKYDGDLASISTESERSSFLASAFSKTNDLPTSGNILSIWQNCLHKQFLGSTGTVLHGQDNLFARLSTKDIALIDQSIAQGNLTKDKQTECLKSLHAAITVAFKAHPQLKEPGHTEEISALVRHLCDTLQQQGSKISMDKAIDAALDFAILRQIKAEGMQEIFKQVGISPEFGQAVLQVEEFRKGTLQAVIDLESNRTEAEIANVVQKQAKNFIEQYRNVLLGQGLDAANADMEPKYPEDLAKIGLAFADLLQKMRDNKSSEVDLLCQINRLAERFLDPKLAPKARGEILKTLTETLFAPSGIVDKIALCQSNKDRFGQLLGQLQSVVARKGDYTPDVRQACDKTAMVLNVIYESLLQHVPEETREALALEVVSQPANNPQLARQIERPGGQPVVPIQRNATPAEIFAAKQKLLSEGWDKNLTSTISQLTEDLKCTDHQLLHAVRGNKLDNTLGSLHTAGDYADNLNHYFTELKYLGEHLNSLCAQYPQHSPTELMQLYMDMFIATHSDEQLAKVLDGLYSDQSRLLLDVMTNHAAKEAMALNGAKSEKLEVIWQTFSALPYLVDKIAEKLGREKPGPLLTGTEKTILDLPKQDMKLGDELKNQFPTHLNLFDEKMFMIKEELDSVSYERLKNFYGQLKLPADADQPQTVNKATIDDYFYADMQDADEEQTMWNIEHLAVMFAFHAKELDALLETSNSNPTPQALWQILHGGEAPHDLNMDNFVEKLMQRTVEEVNTYAKIINAKMVYPDAFINLSYTALGISPNTLLQKFSQVAHEDVTITMHDQLLHHGLFKIRDGTEYKDGSKAYGFGNDFIRAKMPLGENRKDGEGCKISVVVNDQETVFTQKAYNEFTAKEKEQGRTYNAGQLDHPYMREIVNTVRPLCQSDAQLAGVGYCTTQAVQMALRNPKNFYKDVSGGAMEHTALDHRIEPLNDGSVKVTIKEKPGAFFKFNMEIVVDKEGKLTMNKGEVTYPSYDKWQDYKQAHPEEMLD
ncbi:MAG: hypothetical protein IJS50_06135 [Desulfovibrio sp.]|nr:hypothetical protein [Desulfovibrio sp.]